MITATAIALQQMKKLREQHNMPDGYLKISLKGGGCSGFVYEVSFTEAIDIDDIIVMVDEKTEEAVFISKRSYPFLNGMEIDYAKDLDSDGFRFNVPDSKSCGCGLSFSAGERL